MTVLGLSSRLAIRPSFTQLSVGTLEKGATPSFTLLVSNQPIVVNQKYLVASNGE